MSNENTNAMGSQMDDIAKMKEYFEKLKNPQGSGKANNGLKGEELLKKMFTPRNSNEVFRILPVSTPSEVTQVAYFHVMSIHVGNGQYRWKKLYCPEHNDELIPKKDDQGNIIKDQAGNPVLVKPKCALCDKARSILSKQDQSLKGVKKENMTPQQQEIQAKNKEIWMEGTKYEAKKFHIIKGIDRGIEKDGPKFWRFKDNRKQQGVLDKLIPVLGDYMSQFSSLFYDIEKGADLSITVTENSMPNGRGTYKDVSAINYRQPSKLSNDPVILQQWINDKTTWKDVFRPQTAPNITNERYLELVAEGNNPYWDDTDPQNKRWVFPNHPDLEAKANTRDMDLSADPKPSQEPVSNVSINQVTEQNVGTYNDDAINMGAVPPTNQNITPNYGENSNLGDIDDTDDLPF